MSSTNEESSSNSNSSKKDDATSAKLSPLKSDQTLPAPKIGVPKSPTPPVPAFTAAMQRAGAVQVNHVAENPYKYKPVFKQPSHYIKYKEPVYEGFESFSFKEQNYEIMQKDMRFLETTGQQ